MIIHLLRIFFLYIGFLERISGEIGIFLMNMVHFVPYQAGRGGVLIRSKEAIDLSVPKVVGLFKLRGMDS